MAQVNYLQIVKSALGLLPVVIEAVKAIEAALPESGAGAQKLDIIKATLQNAYSVSSDAVGTFESFWPVLSGMISAIVAAMNAAGIFKKKTV